MNVFIYLFLVFFSYLLPAFVLYQLLRREFDKQDRLNSFFDKTNLIIISIGISLPITTLILYYGLWILPKNSELFYFLLFLIIYSIIFISSRFNSSNIHLNFKKNAKIILSLAIIFFIHVYYITHKQITEHDYLEYGILGKIFYNQMYIDYKPYFFQESSYFHFVGLHGYFFPLVLTWEKLLGNFLGVDTDYLFRGVSSIYFILTIFLFYNLLHKIIGKWNALLSLIILIFTYGYFLIALRFHIDTTRIFFFALSVLVLVELLKQKSTALMLLTGAILGVSAFAHSLGIFLAVIFIFTYLLVSKNKLRAFYDVSIILCVFMIFGGLHYLVDVISGTGWIFKNFRFYL